jgi:hypothetical protein
MDNLVSDGLYTIFETATGRIIRSGVSGDLALLRENLAPGWALYEGEALDDGEWVMLDGVKTAYVAEIDLQALETELLAAIDLSAEITRGHFITNTASQPVVYLAKEAEATALMADIDLSPALTPNITLEAARRGETRFDVAVVILTQAHNWREMSAVIENMRLGAKDAVRAASTAEAKRAAADIDWSGVLALAPG